MFSGENIVRDILFEKQQFGRNVSPSDNKIKKNNET
jgi:hypothetical protein